MEVLIEFEELVVAPDGTNYGARVCGSPAGDGVRHWHGWIEFLPVDGGVPVRTGRETTQPNRACTEYWATGLTPVYLEGALRRALGSGLVAAEPSSSLTPPSEARGRRAGRAPARKPHARSRERSV